jgi:hypothetical protein
MCQLKAFCIDRYTIKMEQYNKNIVCAIGITFNILVTIV